MDPDRPWRTIEDRDGGDDGGPADRPVRGRPLAIGALVAAALLAAASIAAIATGGEGATGIDSGTSQATGHSPGVIVVQVAGAVAHPGLIELATGSRLADAIAAAGGLSPRVDATRMATLQLASVLRDGATVFIPSRDDPDPSGISPDAGPAGTAGAGGSQVDLNSATAAELEALPGIGPVTAAKIIASRQENRFEAVEDLTTRKLVGAKTFEKVRDLVTVR
jgi:competence protein ComEA